MTDYFQHCARKSRPAEVALEVVEFDEPQSAGIEVSERQFDSTGEFLAFIARETGRGP